MAMTLSSSIGLPDSAASMGEFGAWDLTCAMKLGVTNGTGTKARARHATIQRPVIKTLPKIVSRPLENLAISRAQYPGSLRLWLGSGIRGPRAGDNRTPIPEDPFMARKAISQACGRLTLLAEQLLPAIAAPTPAIPPRVFATMQSTSVIPMGVMTQVYQHPEFKAAATEISRARFLKPILSHADRPGPLLGVGRFGSASIAQPETLAFALVGGAIEYFAIDGITPTRDQLQARIEQSAEELEAGLAGAKVPVTRVVGLGDCPLADGCTIMTPWGEVRRAQGRLTELTMDDRTAEALMVTTYADSLNIIPQGMRTVAEISPSELEFQTRWQTLLPLAAILGSGSDGRFAPTPLWQRVVSCVSGVGGMSGWVPESRFPSQRSEPLRADECALIGAWAERLELRFDEQYLGVAARRIVRAVSSRLDNEARLIDAVIAWEALVGTGTEVTFRITAALAALLADHPSSRLNIAKRLRRTYGKRSKVAHGERIDGADLMTAATSAIEDAVTGLRNLLLDHDDLVESTSADRSDALIFSP